MPTSDQRIFRGLSASILSIVNATTQRLKATFLPERFTPVVGNCTTIGSTVVADVEDVATVTVSMKNTGTVAMAAGTFLYEVSPNSTTGADGDWFSIVGGRSSAASNLDTSMVGGSLAANAVVAYGTEFDVAGYKMFRIRCSVAVTTNAIATFTIRRSAVSTTVQAVVSVNAGTVTAAISGLPTPTTVIRASTADTNAVNIRNAAATLWAIAVSNQSASPRYLKVYNKASAPTLASDIPVQVIAVPAGSYAVLQYGAVGTRFSAGISVAITGGAADTDTTAVLANEVKLMVSYS